MNLPSVFIFLLFLTLLNTGSIFAENLISEKENLSSSEKFRSPIISKIHPTLIQWKISDDPNEFAKQNNLSYIDRKIEVYIYLESVESQIKIPQDITITGSDQKIIVGFVSAEQLDMLEKLDFVERITLPDYAQNPPIPQVKTITPSNLKTPQSDYLVGIVIGIIIAVTIIFLKVGIFKKQKNFKPKK